jgi:hypothetical protein
LSLRALWLALALCGCVAASHASSASLRVCDRASPLTARQQDHLLRFAAIVKRELDDSGEAIALIARSGLDLQRFGIRYSHAGVSLKASDNTPWSVRQLYFACDEGRPRLYDQGLAGFLFGTDDPTIGYVSIVLLPRHEAAALEQAALDKARALRLLAASYSANAYPFSLRYQNCNQWVMELLATAWGELGDAADLRARAQAWLLDRSYAPRLVEVGSHALMFAAGFIPWLHLDDHPEEDLRALRFRISLPDSIEAFVRAHAPSAQRVELCHDERQVVVRRGWEPVADGCRPNAGDTVFALD